MNSTMDNTMNPAAQELVVLLDPAAAQRGEIVASGTAPKATVHSTDTPLHLAFSCYLLDGDGRLLVTRRALTKTAWPGVWTNTLCGHPAPGEALAAGLVRRSAQELGLDPATIGDVTCVLDDFMYRATDSRGIVEWEFCPTFVAQVEASAGSQQVSLLNPDPGEVDSWAWVNPADYVAAVRATPFAFSPWSVEQLGHPQLLAALGLSA